MDYNCPIKVGGINVGIKLIKPKFALPIVKNPLITDSFASTTCYSGYDNGRLMKNRLTKISPRKQKYFFVNQKRMPVSMILICQDLQEKQVFVQ